ncbi:hypothetical protein GOBAR_AA05339 [Gossypium barbadense]|uniref:Uncharacterized protein n=1 Tax=Gossypium barbadense TaxID=3634 RepID=A0A2P5YI38_GOSBA|nr:hypothetical protein GOBAR_AA05339 [Gossypium barbadense]
MAGEGPNMDNGGVTVDTAVMVEDDRLEESPVYGPWMLVERKLRHNFRDPRNPGEIILEANKKGKGVLVEAKGSEEGQTTDPIHLKQGFVAKVGHWSGKEEADDRL